jgi:tetratricopeptide (TPR) repeat protein
MQSIGFATRPGLEVMPRAEKAASRALELDPSLPEAHLARALTYMYGQWDYPAAKEELDRALALNPNSAEAHFWAEFYWTYTQHDFEKAIAANRRAVELSPLDTRIRGRFATVNYLFGEMETAEQALRGELAENPDHPLPHVSMADTLVRMGRFDEAVPHSEEAARLGGRAHAFLGMLGGFYGLQGNRAAAEAVLKELEDRQRAGYTPGFWMAVAYSGAGRLDDAFAALERAVVEKDSNLLYLFFSPRAAGMHDDPRFDDILKRIGLEHLLQYK